MMQTPQMVLFETPATVGGTAISVSGRVFPSNLLTIFIEFTLWTTKPRHFRPLVDPIALSRAFHRYQPRDARSFGLVTDLATVVSTPQLVCIAEQFVRDIFRAVDLIVTRYPREAYSYAAWYRTSRGPDDHARYEVMVTQYACDCIFTTQLVNPSVSWECVEFPAPPS